MKIRIISALLVILMLATVFCSCGDVAKPEDTKAQTTAAVNSDGPDETTERDTLGDKTWGGRTLSILGVYDSHEPSFEICPEEGAEDNVSVAAFARNARLEKQYDVKIEQVGNESATANFEINVLGGTAEYDLAFLYRDDMASAISKNLFRNILELPYIDWERSCYKPKTIDALLIDGKLYHMSSDFSLVDKNRVTALFLNRDMAADNNIPDIITQVREGKWTFENFFNYVAQVSYDKNGDGKMDYQNDVYGVTIGSNDESINFWTGMGCKTVSVDGEGELYMSYTTDHAIEACEKIRNVFANPNLFFASKTSDNYAGAGQTFREGRALFYGAAVCELPSLSGNVEFSYTILPFPKFDADQDSYYSNSNNRFCATFGVPICAKDPDFSAFMIEALSRASTDTTLSNFYEVNCKFRNSYDKDCSDMLDILFECLTYDFGFLYDSVFSTNGTGPKAVVSSALRSTEKSLTTGYAESGVAQRKTLKKLISGLNK